MCENKNIIEVLNFGIQFFSESSNDSSEEEKKIDDSENSTDEVIIGDTNVLEDSSENSADVSAEQEINFETGEPITSFQKESPLRTIITNVFDIIEVFSYALAMMVIVFLFVIKFVTVDGSSMFATLKNEDRLIICNLFYTPETDDVVVINYKARDELLVKRVIGVEGDTIKIKFDTWEIWVNGEYLEQPYLINTPEYLEKEMEKGHLINVDEDNSITFTVEEGKVFVLGDNRNHSSDSRVFGQLDKNEIWGKVIFRVYPLESASKIE